MEKDGNRFLFTKSRRRKQRGPSKPAEMHWGETSRFLPLRTGSDAPPSAPSHARRAPAAPSHAQQDEQVFLAGAPRLLPASSRQLPASARAGSQIGTLNSKSCSNLPQSGDHEPTPAAILKL